MFNDENGGEHDDQYDDRHFTKDQPDHLSDPAPTYDSIFSVPKPLVATVQRAYESGLSVKDIATIFELPDAWVKIWCGEKPATTRC